LNGITRDKIVYIAFRILIQRVALEAIKISVKGKASVFSALNK
jgi:hypothetical protein